MLAVGDVGKGSRKLAVEGNLLNLTRFATQTRFVTWKFLLIHFWLLCWCAKEQKPGVMSLNVVQIKSLQIAKQIFCYHQSEKAFEAVGRVKEFCMIHERDFHSKSFQSPSTLTDKIQFHRVAFDGLSGNLTVVQTSISLLSKFDLQCPLVRLFVMCRCETLVSRVSVCSNSQNMQISMTNPRDLSRKSNWNNQLLFSIYLQSSLQTREIIINMGKWYRKLRKCVSVDKHTR